MLHLTVRKALPVLGCALLFFSVVGCMPRKINRWVGQHYNEIPQKPSRNWDSAIVVTSALPDMSVPCQTERKSTYLLPLIFYWEFEHRNTCTLNPKPAIDNFTSTVLANIASELNQKLKGNQLVLRIDQLPQVFVVNDRGHYADILIWWLRWDNYTVNTQLKDMVISYRLVNAANVILKKGTIIIPDKENIAELGSFKSLRKVTKQHLDEYDANITAMARKVAERLNSEL